MKTEQEIYQAQQNLKLHHLAQEKIGNDEARIQVACTLGAVEWILNLETIGAKSFQKFIMDNTTTLLGQNANNRNS